MARDQARCTCIACCTLFGSTPMVEINDPYEFGMSPHTLLSERQYTHCLALRGLVQDTLYLWDKGVPPHLHALAEDLSSITPSWLDRGRNQRGREGVVVMDEKIDWD